MPTRRRLIGALSSAFLLQLMLVGSGAPCVMHTAGGAAGNASHNTMLHAARTDAPASCSASASMTGCQLPSSPRTCALSACASISVMTVASISLATAPPEIGNLPEPPARQSATPSAPDLPPPRG